MFSDSIRDILSKQEITTRFFEKNGIELAFIFGSILESKSHRDVDIAVLFKNYSFKVYLETYEALHKLLKVNNIDLVVLNRTNAAIKLEAILKGVLLFAENKEGLLNFIADTFFEYEDYRHFKNEYTFNFHKRSLEGLSMSERKLNRERIETYLSKLDEAVGKLTRLRKSFSSYEDFKSKVDTRELCVHYLRIALESVLDVCRHFLAVKGVSITEIDTTSIIELSGEKGLIPYEFSKKIRGMAGMRNAIVYGKLDTQELTDFDDFVRYVKWFIERESRDSQ
ncbi:MAG: HepT-like ribonuclease domain-containing protein [Methanosarcinales archaeon]